MSKHKELERQHKTQELTVEQEQSSLKIQLAEYQQKITNYLAELKAAKTQEAQVHEQVGRNIKKYNDLLYILSAVILSFLIL